MTYTLDQFQKMVINDLERAKFCLDSSGNVAVRWIQGISARGNPVETWAELPITGAIDGEAIVVRNDPVVGSTIAIWNGAQWIQLGAFDYNKVGIDGTDLPGYLSVKLVQGTGITIVQSEPTPGNKIMTINYAGGAPMTCSDVIDCIESATAIDMSGATVTLGEIGGDITFTNPTTIDRTNTTSTGVQDFGNLYIANYDGSTINITNNATMNIDSTTVNIDNSVRNSTNNTYTYDGDTINYINNTSITYDETTIVTYEGDVYIGGTIIVMNNNNETPGTITQVGPGVAFTNLNNAKLCDLAYAVATPIDPTARDVVKLIVGGTIAGNNLGQLITGGNPAIYGNASQLRGNVLTPAIVNASDFGVSFKFGDSQTILATNFGFLVPLTDTILGVKVEVIFNSTADTVSVDCFTITVYHTAGTSVIALSITEEFTGNNTDDDFTLAHTYVSDAKVYLNGLRINTSNYTVTGTTLHMNAVPATGDEILIDYLY